VEERLLTLPRPDMLTEPWGVLSSKGDAQMRKMVVLTAALALCLVGSQARASLITDKFTVSNFTNSTVSSPYATLTVSGDDAKNGLVKFDLKVDGNSAYLNELGFNLANGVKTTDFKLDALSGDTTGKLNFQKQMDGFGTYAVQFDHGKPGSSSGTTELTFTLKMENNKVADASNFFGLNGGNAANPPGKFNYAADYFPTVGLTGYVGAPAPSSAVLAASTGLCLLPLGLMAAYKRRKLAA
jgi:hypothetical protein